MTRIRLRHAIADDFRRRGFRVLTTVDDILVIVGPSRVAFLRPRASSEKTGGHPSLETLSTYGYPAKDVRSVQEAEDAVFNAPHLHKYRGSYD